MNNNKKLLTGGIATGVAAITIASIITFNRSNDVKLEGGYQINNINPYLSEITITMPEEFTPDICELKFNGLSVTKTILPHGAFTVHPIVTKNANKLSLDMYIRGELVGKGDFTDIGIINITTSTEYLNKEVTIND